MFEWEATAQRPRTKRTERSIKTHGISPHKKKELGGTVAENMLPVTLPLTQEKHPLI